MDHKAKKSVPFYRDAFCQVAESLAQPTLTFLSQ